MTAAGSVAPSAFKKEVDAEFPDEAHLSKVAKASDDYAFACKMAFAHMSSWR